MGRETSPSIPHADIPSTTCLAGKPLNMQSTVFPGQNRGHNVPQRLNGVPGYRVQGIWIFVDLKIWISGSLDIWKFGYLDIWIMVKQMCCCIPTLRFCVVQPCRGLLFQKTGPWGFATQNSDSCIVPTKPFTGLY